MLEVLKEKADCGDPGVHFQYFVPLVGEVEVVGLFLLGREVAVVLPMIFL